MSAFPSLSLSPISMFPWVWRSSERMSRFIPALHEQLSRNFPDRMKGVTIGSLAARGADIYKDLSRYKTMLATIDSIIYYANRDNVSLFSNDDFRKRSKELNRAIRRMAKVRPATMSFFDLNLRLFSFSPRFGYFEDWKKLCESVLSAAASAKS